MMSQFLLNSDVVEHTVFMHNAWLYGILFLRDWELFDFAFKYVCWLLGYGISLSELCFFDIYIPLCPETMISRYFIKEFYGFIFLLSSSMNDISFSLVPFQIMKISSMYPRNSRVLP